MSRWQILPSPDVALADKFVLAVDVSRPDENFEGLAQQLEVQGFKGRVLFDLLTCNGPGKHRFFLLGFDGKQFELRDIERLEEPTQKLRKAATALLQAHVAKLDLALLTPAQRFAVRNAVVL